jgi:hypothetical protein
MSSEDFRCRARGETGVQDVLSLGQMPLVNALQRADELDTPRETYPLDLVFCPRCTLVQITETVPPETLFGEYLYLSSYSDTTVANAREVTKRILRSRGLGAESFVVEIASNDGYLLQFYRDAGVPILGVEPARNIAAIAEERGIPTRAEFFDAAVAEAVRDERGPADVIHGNNVLAHVADLTGVVRGLRALLADGGVGVIEVPYVVDTIAGCEFDQIYHEHLCYFSLTALDRLFRLHDLRIVDVERIGMHGGSLRVSVSTGADGPAGDAVARLLEEESRAGVDTTAYYEGFAERVHDLRASLRRLLGDLKQEGRSLAAYGAAGKGTILLHFCGIGRETLDFVVDRNEHKQGLFMPNLALEVLAPQALLERRPDDVLLLTWNFADEILGQQAEYRRRGGRFVIPIPEPRVVV